MEIAKPLADITQADRDVLERLFGHSLEPLENAVVILKTVDAQSGSTGDLDQDGIPKWCNVLEGLTDDQLAEFAAVLREPVRLGRNN